MTRRRTEAERIRAQHRARLVAAPARLSPAAEVVDVVGIDALVRLADRCVVPVHHRADPRTGAEVYFVDDGGVRYRYRAAGRPAPHGRRVTL